MKRIFFAAFTIAVGIQMAFARDFSGPWNMKALSVAPKMKWGVHSNLVQEVFYEGEPFNGRPTHVFAYVGRPEGVGPFPAVVLVHGGGGKAFYDWADHWAKRGYVSISMDTAGFGPSGKLADGGPDQSDEMKFRNFTRAEIPDMWTYHAVADAIRAHSLLLSLPEVDRKRTALTGISWGGYLTCIIAGIDHRFRAAVPVYGCGFLGEDSYWKDKSLAAMNPEARALWLDTFDPSKYLSGVSCPILFFNGTHDFAYPLDSYQKCFHLVSPRLRYLSVVMKLPHGHIWNFKEPDAFIDAMLAHEPFPRIASLRANREHVSAKSTQPMREAQLYFTTDSGPWDKRNWTTSAASIDSRRIRAEVPEPIAKDPNLTVLITATTPEGVRVSSEYLQPNARSRN